MVAEEAGRTFFVDLAGGHEKNELNDVFLLGFHAEPVEEEKKVGCSEAGTLVSVNERMVFHDTKQVRCCERAQIRFLIGLFLQRAMKRRLKRTFIADAAGTAVKAQLLDMQRFDEVT